MDLCNQLTQNLTISLNNSFFIYLVIIVSFVREIVSIAIMPE